ncbi:hypothetical protein KGMB02408_40500 [Bacteroides faecalis]|uniref:Uncharacterized protein n=1 Tax=Bacteroides faecalis TaxID=2447885 RepID=A0A401M051_9BACE|nr:hypothetical protein KGMB02408_40500 [Bacteroides faecalis]
MPASRSAEIGVTVSGNKGDENNSFGDTAIDLLYRGTPRSESLSANVYLVLPVVSDIRNMVFLLI